MKYILVDSCYWFGLLDDKDSYAPLFKEPDFNSEMIFKAIESDKVYVIEKTNKLFYKVKTRGKVGYLWERWIKE